MQRLSKIDDRSGRVGDFFIVLSVPGVSLFWGVPSVTGCNRCVHLTPACQGMRERGGCTSRLMQESSRCTRHHARGMQSTESGYASYMMIRACMQACMRVHSECAYMYQLKGIIIICRFAYMYTLSICTGCMLVYKESCTRHVRE